MKKALLLSLVLCCTSFVYAQLSNLDFENWHMDTTGNLKLNTWRHYYNNTDHSDAGGMLGTWRVNNSQSGLYALKISRWYASAYDEVRQYAPMASKPTYLNGYYMYEDPNLSTKMSGGTPVKDTAVITVRITKWNMATMMRDTIGEGIGHLTEANSYTPFSVPISYASPQTPDSVSITIVPTSTTKSNTPLCPNGGTCSFLTVDNLSFSQSVTVPAILSKGALHIFPNPVSDIFYIDVAEATDVRLLNSLGSVISVYTLQPGVNKIALPKLAPGFYFISTNDAHYKLLKL